ncbi:MAG TPA: SGNH/GDSL hydrolase family protein [Albitalea sp.]|nr:SGNH/GDSL hydrolase family protein [Albitalea sp.]
MVWLNGLRAGVLRVTGALLLGAALASCGGGEQVQKFVPQRILSFGDENSVIVDGGDHNGAKYTVNALKDVTAGTLDCKANPIWNEYLATAYALVFPQCNPDAVTTTSNIYAAPGALANLASAPNAGVSDVAAQVDSFIAQGNSFNGKDLVTVLAGGNDIYQQYLLIKAGTIDEAQAAATLEQAGSALAAQVNRIALAGGKVLISTVPDLGTTPFGVNEDLAVSGRAALLTRLTARLNAKLRIGLINDGHMIGLILSDESISSVIKNVSGFVNVKQGVCAVALPGCKTTSLITPTDGTTASGDTWLWADDLHLSAGGHKIIGSLAVTRATGNPF